MLFTFFTILIFLAELIIAITMIQNLLKLDKAIIEYDETITEAKPVIKDICILTGKISEQFIEFANRFAKKFQIDNEVLATNVVKAFLTAYLTKRLKLGKTLKRAFSLLKIVI